MSLKKEVTPNRFFEDLQTGLLEGIAHFRGEIELRVITLSEHGAPPPLEESQGQEDNIEQP